MVDGERKTAPAQGEARPADGEHPAPGRDGLAAREAALRSAREGLIAGMAGAGSTARRLARSLAGALETRTSEAIAATARAAEEAGDADLLPRLEELLAAIHRTLARASAVRTGILVIEPDPAKARAEALALACPGRSIYLAPTVRQAERMLEEKSIALVVVELAPADPEGWGLLMRLRDSHRTARLPVIAIAAPGGGSSRSASFALGADGFLERPVDPASLGALAGALLQRSRDLEHESRHDALTGLPNRAALEDAFERMAARARRFDSPLSLALVDVDRFKSVNDAHGHRTGDDALRHVAQTVAAHLRGSDLLARWGGEEFVALCPDTAERGAVRAVEKAAAGLRRNAFPLPSGESLCVTISAGVVEVGTNQPLADAFAAADHLLYVAKASGRDRVVGSGDGLSPPRRVVLLAEDDDLFATLLERSFAANDFDLVRFRTGAELLARAPDSHASLAMLDVRLPDIDGFEVLSALRAHPALSTLPILMLTAMGREQDVLRGFDLGADDYVLKPFSPVELLARVRRLLRKR